MTLGNHNEVVGGYIGFTPSVRLSVRPSVCPSRIPCPLCSAYSSSWIHFIFTHLIEQLQKVCRMESFLQNFKIWIFGIFFQICNFDFVFRGGGGGISERRRSSCSSLIRSRYKKVSVVTLNLSKTRHIFSLQWRHNGRGSVSNHQPHHCLLNRWFRRRSKKTSKLSVAGLRVGMWIPRTMASNAENVSIWWRHHVQAVLFNRFSLCEKRVPGSLYLEIRRRFHIFLG